MTSYVLTPAIQALLERSAHFTPLDNSLNARRVAFQALCRAFTPATPGNLTLHDICLDGLSLRLYLPAGEPPDGGWPVMLYLHGGGWSMGNLDSHDWFVYPVMQRVPIAVVAVAYRLAPEQPYPAALEDTLTAWHLLRRGALRPSLSTVRMLVCGESAGGTLAAALCVALQTQGQVQPLTQVLLYPVLTASEQLPSARECADAPFLTSAALKASIETYLPNPEDRDAATAMPLNALTLRGLASAFIGVVEHDPLRDHGIEYHCRLLAEGVASSLYVGEGLVHGCLRDAGITEVAALYDRVADHVRAALAVN
ncbi:alpha/beta hydrolase [Pantoea sp. Ap-967]|uniref:alpha/beta hydrolase n=1 Tax=Pantoea sp. Ap-967 TaxID=2608362 RepID=UPI001420319E|nr:alpha/beta hydrolase [Pantoea sp. Ap-967]NIE73304.1 alpha/beta hydrolase [Pantoea sp. Ap-967]